MANKQQERTEGAAERRRRSKEDGEKLENVVLRVVRDSAGDLLQVFPKWPRTNVKKASEFG